MTIRATVPLNAAAQYAGAALCAILLSACASNGGSKSAAPTPTAAEQYAASARPIAQRKPEQSVRDIGKADKKYRKSIEAFANPQPDPDGLDPIAAAAFWGSRYDREPQNADVATKYSEALRKIGSVNEAVEVISKSAARHPDHPGVALETGRALIEAGRSFEAVRYLETAVSARRNDWRALSAYGVALDQIGEHQAARQKYDAALLVSPDSVSVLSNKGLSYAMSGDLDHAERLLRAAATHRRADARIRQNFALVLALKGELKEAERLARSDLPPQIADQNVEYYRSLSAQPVYWQSLAGAELDAPTFDDAPAAPVALAPTPSLSEEKRKLKQPRREKKATPDEAPTAQAAPTQATPASTDAAPASTETPGSNQ